MNGWREAHREGDPNGMIIEMTVVQTATTEVDVKIDN